MFAYTTAIDSKGGTDNSMIILRIDKGNISVGLKAYEIEHNRWATDVVEYPEQNYYDYSERDAIKNYRHEYGLERKHLQKQYGTL